MWRAYSTQDQVCNSNYKLSVMAQKRKVNDKYFILSKFEETTWQCRLCQAELGVEAATQLVKDLEEKVSSPTES